MQVLNHKGTNIEVPFLSLHDVTAMHGEEIREAARRVIDSGWYLHFA